MEADGMGSAVRDDRLCHMKQISRGHLQNARHTCEPWSRESCWRCSNGGDGMASRPVTPAVTWLNCREEIVFDSTSTTRRPGYEMRVEIKQPRSLRPSRGNDVCSMLIDGQDAPLLSDPLLFAHDMTKMEKCLSRQRQKGPLHDKKFASRKIYHYTHCQIPLVRRTNSRTIARASNQHKRPPDPETLNLESTGHFITLLRSRVHVAETSRQQPMDAIYCSGCRVGRDSVSDKSRHIFPRCSAIHSIRRLSGDVDSALCECEDSFLTAAATLHCSLESFFPLSHAGRALFFVAASRR